MDLNWDNRARQYILKSLKNYCSGDDFGLELSVILLDQGMHLIWMGAVSDDPENDIFLYELSWPAISKQFSLAGNSPLQDFELEELYELRKMRNEIVHDIYTPNIDESKVGYWIWLAVAIGSQIEIGFRENDFKFSKELLSATKFCTEDDHVYVVRGRIDYAASQLIDENENLWAHNNTLEEKIGYENQEGEMVYPDIVITNGKDVYEAIEVVTPKTLTLESAKKWIINDIDVISAPKGYFTLADDLANKVGFKGQVWWYRELPKRKIEDE